EGCWVLPPWTRCCAQAAAWTLAACLLRVRHPLSRKQATRDAWSHGQPMASASGWAVPSWRLTDGGVRGLIEADGRYGGRNFGERPGARSSAETALLMLPMPWTTSPASSAALGSCDPLCSRCAPGANAVWPRTECPLASVEGRWSPLASVVVRQPDAIVT